jgi:predicted ABC-type ATPase
MPRAGPSAKTSATHSQRTSRRPDARTSACSVLRIGRLPSPDTPRLWIVAGPNGSGKSTLYDATDIEDFGRSVWIINPDTLAARIRDQEGKTLAVANREALDRIQAWLDASIAAHQTVGAETVLSTDKYRALVIRAKSLGFEIRLLYVTLQTADMNVERVRLRVAHGGHHVDEVKIRARRERSFRQLPWFFKEADLALVYDNSGATPKLVARKEADVIKVERTAPKAIIDAIESLKD